MSLSIPSDLRSVIARNLREGMFTSITTKDDIYDPASLKYAE